MTKLAINHLTAGYGKLEILHDLSLGVEPGQFVGILGPNGSGKSTLLKSIFGLTTIFSGTIQFETQIEPVALQRLPTEAIGAKGLAYVPQRENVFASLSVRENLQLAVRNLTRTAAEERLQAAYTLFPILRDRLPQRAGSLSGGERQMLAIALGWLPQPQIMLLDEPSAGLSPKFVSEVFRTLQQLAQAGMTLVVVEQNARSLLRWCDYAYLLREGQLAFQGSANALLADEETVKNYLGVMGQV
jgi:branched-chain amino acid transport system ATP-binding protein